MASAGTFSSSCRETGRRGLRRGRDGARLAAREPAQVAGAAAAGAASAWPRLAANPNRFLSAVQIGVTVAGCCPPPSVARRSPTASSRAPAEAGPARAWPRSRPGADHDWSSRYVSLVFGELAPKRLALQRAERSRSALAPLVDRMRAVARPVIWLLSRSTDLVVRLLGGDPNANREVMSDEELRDLVAGARGARRGGARDRRRGVRRPASRQLREVMLPRTEVEFLDAAMPAGTRRRVRRRAAALALPGVWTDSATTTSSASCTSRDLLDPAVARVRSGSATGPRGR